MTVVLSILGQEIALACAPADERRLRDLAAALDKRLAGLGGDPDGARRLALTALSLLDEVQAARAALVRAHGEIERLTDMVVDARLEASVPPINDDLGRVEALRVAHDAA